MIFFIFVSQSLDETSARKSWCCNQSPCWYRQPDRIRGRESWIRTGKKKVHYYLLTCIHIARNIQGPYLQIDIQEGGWRSRVKRTTINRVCSEEYDPKVTQCCMWPLKIDFDEFNWDWILFPRSYDANFCSGDCSLGRMNVMKILHIYTHTFLF